MDTGAYPQKLPSLSARGIVSRVHAGLTVHVKSLEIMPADMIGILGPNGAGKTTLMNLLTGTLRPVQGEVVMHNRAVHAMPAPELAARRTVVRASSDSATAGLTAREVIELGALSNPLPLPLLHALVSAYAQAFDLAGRLDADFAVLSSGEKKRVEIARALVQIYGREAGHVLFLDEPFAHLDSRHAHAVKKELIWLRQKGVAIVCILHDINFAAQNCNRIIFMRDAQIIEETDSSGVYRPQLLERVYDTPFAVLRSGRRRYVIAKS
jgi:iron complex transport system ATP-binding protein